MHGVAGFEATKQHVCEAGVEKRFANGSTDEIPRVEESARRGVGEADFRFGINEEECIAEGVEQAVAFVVGLLEVGFEAEFPGFYVGLEGCTGAAKAEGESQQGEQGDEGRDGRKDGD